MKKWIAYYYFTAVFWHSVLVFPPVIGSHPKRSWYRAC